LQYSFHQYQNLIIASQCQACLDSFCIKCDASGDLNSCLECEQTHYLDTTAGNNDISGICVRKLYQVSEFQSILEKINQEEFTKDIFVSNLEADYQAGGQTGDFSTPLDDLMSAMNKVEEEFPHLVFLGRRTCCSV
jgi:hypothetical protein